MGNSYQNYASSRVASDSVSKRTKAKKATTRENDRSKAEIRKDKGRRTRMIQQPPKGKDSHIGRYPEKRGEVGEVQRKMVATGKEKRPSTRRVKERQGKGTLSKNMII